MNTPVLQNRENLRLNQLHGAIETTFGEFAESTDLGTFEDSLTDMVEITRVRPKGASAENFGRDRLFAHVVFPPAIQMHLKSGDVFLVTMGLRRNEWIVVGMSPPYESH